MGMHAPGIYFKDKMMEILLSSKSIVSLIDDDDYKETPALGLRYTKVYPYNYIPDTADKASVFVCFDYNIIKVKTDAIADFRFSLFVYCHKSKMRMSYGTRLDRLSDEIDETLNHTREFGIGKVTPYTPTATHTSVPNYDYILRQTDYKIVDFNYRGDEG